MRLLSILIFSILFSGCSSMLEVKNYEYAWQALHVIDAAQTVQIAKHPECRQEGNPLTRQIIGEHPSESDVYKWWAGSALVHFFLFRWLDKQEEGNFNLFFRLADTSMKFGTVARNHSQGVRVDGLSDSERDRCAKEREFLERRNSINFQLMKF